MNRRIIAGSDYRSTHVLNAFSFFERLPSVFSNFQDEGLAFSVATPRVLSNPWASRINSVSQIQNPISPMVITKLRTVFREVWGALSPNGNGKGPAGTVGLKNEIVALLSNGRISADQYVTALKKIEELSQEVEYFVNDQKKSNSQIMDGYFFFSNMKNLRLILDQYAVAAKDADAASAQILLDQLTQTIFIFMHLHNLVIQHHLKNQGVQGEDQGGKQSGRNFFLTNFVHALHNWRAREGHVLGLLPSEFWEKLVNFMLQETDLDTTNVKELMHSDLPILVKDIFFRHPRVRRAKEEILNDSPTQRKLYDALFFNVSQTLPQRYEVWLRNLSEIYKNWKDDGENTLAWNQALHSLGELLGNVSMSRLVLQFPEAMLKSFLKNCSPKVLSDLILAGASDYHSHPLVLMVPQKPLQEGRKIQLNNGVKASYRLDSDQPVMALYQYSESFKRIATQLIPEDRMEALLKELQLARPELARAIENKFKADSEYFYRSCEISDLGHFYHKLIGIDPNQWDSDTRKLYGIYRHLTREIETRDQDETGLSGKKLKKLKGIR